MAEIDRFERRKIVRIAGLQTLPGKFGEIGRSPRVCSRSWEMCALLKIVLEDCARFGVQITTEQRLAFHLSAEFRQHDITILIFPMPTVGFNKKRRRKTLAPETDERID